MKHIILNKNKASCFNNPDHFHFLLKDRNTDLNSCVITNNTHITEVFFKGS